MKVDKAVSTNGTLEDLVESLKYRELFTTMVRNKILLNKKIYEECKMAKKKRKQAIMRYFFIRKSFCNRNSTSSPSPSSIENVIELKKSRFSPLRGFRRRFMNFRSSKHKVKVPDDSKIDRNVAETRLDQTIQNTNELRNSGNSNSCSTNNVDLAPTSTSTISTNQKNCDQISSILENKVSSLSSTTVLHHDNLNLGQDQPQPQRLPLPTFTIKDEKGAMSGGTGGSAESMPYIFKNTNNHLNVSKHKATSISAECSPILLRHHQMQLERQQIIDAAISGKCYSDSMQLHVVDATGDVTTNIVPIFVDSQSSAAPVKQSSPSILKKHKQQPLQPDIVRYNSSSSSSENSVTIMKFNNARKSNLVDNLGVLPSWPSDGYDPQSAFEKKQRKYRE